MSHHAASVILVSVLVSACGSSPSLPEGTDQSALPPTLTILAVTPDSIQLEIASQDPSRPVWGFGTTCSLRVQRQIDGEWIDAGSLSAEEDEVLNCEQPLILMDPRSVSRFWTRSRASLAMETVPVRVAMPVVGPPAEGSDFSQAGLVVTEPITRE